MALLLTTKATLVAQLLNDLRNKLLHPRGALLRHRRQKVPSTLGRWHVARKLLEVQLPVAVRVECP